MSRRLAVSALGSGGSLPEALGSTTFRNVYETGIPLVGGAQVGDIAVSVTTTKGEAIAWVDSVPLGNGSSSTTRLYLAYTVLNAQMISDGYVALQTDPMPAIYTGVAWFFRGAKAPTLVSIGVFGSTYPAAPNYPGYATFPAHEIPKNHHAVYGLAVGDDLIYMLWQNVTASNYTASNFGSDASINSALYTPSGGSAENKTNTQAQSVLGTGENHVAGIVLIGG